MCDEYSDQYAAATADPLQCLMQRHDWLTHRIEAKVKMGWDVEWDTRERDSLAWAIDKLGVLHRVREALDRG